MLTAIKFFKDYWHYILFFAAFAFLAYQVEQYGERKVYAEWNEDKLAKMVAASEVKAKEEKDTYEIDLDALKEQSFIRQTTEQAKKEASDERKNDPSPVDCIVSNKRVYIYNSLARPTK